MPLKKALEKDLDVPVFIENDCNICALESTKWKWTPSRTACSVFLSALASAAG